MLRTAPNGSRFWFAGFAMQAWRTGPTSSTTPTSSRLDRRGGRCPARCENLRGGEFPAELDGPSPPAQGNCQAEPEGVPAYPIRIDGLCRGESNMVVQCCSATEHSVPEPVYNFG